jgi:hypothetical protein
MEIPYAVHVDAQWKKVLMDIGLIVVILIVAAACDHEY